MRKEFVCVVTRCLLALGFFCAAGAQAADAQTTINVPADQPTIQAGIDAAVDGDTVMVAPGTYFENLNFNGKLITVTSSAGPATTIIDGGGLGPVAIFDTNESADSVLNGFTLQNGAPMATFPGSGTDGAGVFIYYASPTITGNVITGNHAIGGIGVEVFGGSAVIRGNTITGNTQAGGSGDGGAGIEIAGFSSQPAANPQIIGNTITDNQLQAGGDGGGIYVVGFASPLIQNNYIAGNSVFDRGGGIFLQSEGSPILVQNIIVNNSTGGGGSGGGIYVSSSLSSATVVVTNNTIEGNSASDGSSGIFTNLLSANPISNNIVVAPPGQTAIVCSSSSFALPTFSHNDVISPGGGQAFSSNCASFASTSGNISVDPLFVNVAGNDFHLQAGSPATDTGDNTAPNLPQQDYDGNPRVVNASGDCVGTVSTGTVDMGAYELQAIPQASFSASFVSFGAQVLNTTSSPFQLTLSSTGSACLKLTALAITGDFAQTNTCGAELSPGQSCLVNVTFTPTATGTRTGALTLSGNQSGLTEADFSGLGVISISASVSPSSMNFGNQLIGTLSSLQTVTVSNTGTTTLNISSIALSGDPDFLLFNNRGCNLGLAPGSTCSVQIGFEPKAAGAGSALLTISSNATNSPASVSLSGTGVNPANASASPLSLSFGNQAVGTQSPAQTVTVNNTGGDTLFISSLAVTGDTDFSTPSDNCKGATGVAPGASCSIQVQFAPTAGGVGSATLTITSNSANGPVSISVSGTGIQPAISVSPASLNFGSQNINAAAPTQTVTVTNTGSVTLHVNSLVITGDSDFFTAGNDCVGGTGVLPGGTCTIQTEFQPQTAGPGSATLTIGSDAANGPVSVSLSGTGVNPVIATVSPTVLNFGNQAVGSQSPTQIISLTNTGTGVITVSGVAITGDPDFILVDNGCAGGFAAGITCSIQIAFAPKTLGAGSATLTITSNASNNPVSVALSGTGVTPPQASVSPASIDFGSVSIGAHNATPVVTVSNTGGAVLHINSLSITGDTDFFTVTNNCVGGTGVAPGGSCTIQMEFQPQTAGPGSATLTIGSDAANGPVSVSLSGTGVNPVIATVSPTVLNFGNQVVGSQSATQIISLTNTGTGVITVSGVAITGDPDFILVDNGCAGGFAAGITCSIQIAFAPKTLGAGSATLTITSNAGNNPVSVALSGTGVSPAKASVSPASLNFGSLPSGTESAPQTVTVTNIGGAPLDINSQVVTGDADFFITSSNCVGPFLAPGGSCSIQLVFFPHSVGPGSATLTISSNDPASPTSIALSGSGTGPDFSVSASPASLSIRSGHQGQTKITVSAVGGSVSNSVALSCSNLPTGASCSFSPSSVVPGATSASSSLTINTQQSGGIKTPLGAYSITVVGTSAGVVRSTAVTITITN